MVGRSTFIALAALTAGGLAFGLGTTASATVVTTTYKYDPLGRVESATSDSTTDDVTYQYDDAGNRVQVNGPNACPTVQDDLLLPALPGVTTNLHVTNNDSDSDSGDHLTLSSLGTPSNGATIKIASDGVTVKYTPATGFDGVETFTYTVTDGLCERTANVSVSVPHSDPHGP